MQYFNIIFILEIAKAIQRRVCSSKKTKTFTEFNSDKLKNFNLVIFKKTVEQNNIKISKVLSTACWATVEIRRNRTYKCCCTHLKYSTYSTFLQAVNGFLTMTHWKLQPHVFLI